MKRFVLSLLSVLVVGGGLTGAALAGPNAGGVMLLHTDNAVVYTADTNYAGLSGHPCLPNTFGDCPEPDNLCGCSWVTSGGIKTASTRALGEVSVVWLLAAFPDNACARVKAAVFGITWTGDPSGSQLAFGTYGNAGDLEIPQAGWPGQNLGNAITFGSTKHGEIIELYWFSIYAYIETEMKVRGNPAQGNRAEFGDDSTPALVDAVAGFGGMGFGGNPGSVPSLACSTPTQQTSWGSIKATFGH